MKSLEVWKDIKGYEGLYKISNLGKVKSLITNKIIKTNMNNCGYKQVILSNKGKIKSKRIHRLVAEAFIPNPNNLPQVNHKDENKTNNDVNNLEWCDNKYNVNYGTGIERCAKSRLKPVNQYDLNGNFIKRHDGIIVASKELNIHPWLILAVCQGIRKTTHKCVWRYMRMSKSLEIVNKKLDYLEKHKKFTEITHIKKNEAQQIKQDLEVLEIINKKNVNIYWLKQNICLVYQNIYTIEDLLESYNLNATDELTMGELLKLKQWLEVNEND